MNSRRRHGSGKPQAFGPGVYSEDSNQCDECVRGSGCKVKYDADLQRCNTRDRQSSMMKAVACETEAANAYDRCDNDARRQCERAKEC
jgi:hypothetical protein